MSSWHPEPAQLERFLDDELPDEESRALQRHLFACPECEERLIRLLPDRGPSGADRAIGWPAAGGRAATPDPEYQGVIQRVLSGARREIDRRDSRLSRERTAAAEILQELREQGLEQRRSILRYSPRHHSWGLFEQLLEEGRRAVLEAPREAEEWLQLAVELTDFLSARRYGPGSVDAAKARAWGYLGNALRVLADFRGAEEAFARAEEHLSRSWLDPLDEALILEYRAALRRAQRRFDEALALLDEAGSLYREVNEPHAQGRVLVMKGLVLQYMGETAAATRCLRSSLFLVDPAEDPRLVVITHYNLAHCLNDDGHFSEAQGLIAETRPLLERLGGRSDLLRLRWLEAKAADGLGRIGDAESAFLEVRDAFIADGLAYNAALVSLDLAAVYARLGRAAEAKRLAVEMLPIFSSREVHREALAALIVFQRAAEMEQLTLPLVDEISAYLERARGNPGLRFRGGA